MYKTEKLKALINDRLKVVTEDIFVLIEKAFKDYEAEQFRSKQETGQRQGRLDVLKDNGLTSATLQFSVAEDDVPCGQDDCEKKTNLGEDDQDNCPIKEEQDIEVWDAQASEKEIKAENKDSVFSITYVQRIDEDERHLPLQSHIVEKKEGHALSGSSSPAATEDFGILKSARNSQISELIYVKRTEVGGPDSGIHSSTMKTDGEDQRRPYTCNLCDKNFRIKSVLTRHMKTHTKEKPHRCSICGEGFVKLSYLQKHMSSHPGQRPYKCSFCGRGFKQVGHVNTHERIHTGEKPHSCSDCGKSFREKGDLVKHAVIHTGEKPFSCSVCHKKFSSQSNLTRHMKTHSGERPYCCSACGKRFIRRSHLINHMKTHTGEKMYPHTHGSEHMTDEI
ncbi:uncharacterized protein ACNS7B_022777 [Menidia menidia]